MDELRGWVQYFSDLATPKNEEHFDDAYQKKMQFKKLLIEDMALNGEPLPLVDENTIKKFIDSLKNNKAPDVYGITSEHLKYSSNLIVPLMTKIANEVSRKAAIPKIHKLGALTPVPKKGKPVCLPDSYHRITVTPTTGKVIEKIIQQHSKPAYSKAQSPL